MKSVSDYYHESQLACTKKVVIAGFIALILFAVLIIISQYEITEKSSFYLKKRFLQNRKLQAVQLKSTETFEKIENSKNTQLVLKEEIEIESNLSTSLRLDYVDIIQKLLQDNLVLQQKLNRTLQLLKKYAEDEAALCPKSEQEFKAEVEQQKSELKSQTNLKYFNAMSSSIKIKSDEYNLSYSKHSNIVSTGQTSIRNPSFDSMVNKSQSNNQSIAKHSTTTGYNNMTYSKPVTVTNLIYSLEPKLDIDKNTVKTNANTVIDGNATSPNATSVS